MIQNNNLRVSIVIPVYNEAQYLGACLEAIARQAVAPFEVIVVDNNSTDETIAVAERFGFVTVLCESRQGVVYARDRGFDVARGDIIGRIDADSLITPNWVATLQLLFANSQLGAVSGRVSYQNVVARSLVDRVDLFWRRRMAHVLGAEVALQGANMAVRSIVWRQIRGVVCHAANLHEDFDVAVHAHQAGWVVRFDEALRATICYRQADYSFRAFCVYTLIAPRTYAVHGLKSGRHMYEVVCFVVICYPLIKFLHRGFDYQKNGFSLHAVFDATVPARVNPATFVD
jgi:glycosyltransferase involved in cell wall biosynthesis